MSAANPISSDKSAPLFAPVCPAPIDVRIDGGGAMVSTFSCFGTGVAPFLSGAIAMGPNRSTISRNQERER